MATVEVINMAPTAVLNIDTSVDEGSTAVVNFSGQADGVGSDASAGFSYSFDFDNDGVFEITGSPSPFATVPASFLDDGPGSRTVLGRIADKDGGFTDYRVTIPIENVAPSAVLSVGGAVVEGSSGSMSFSGQFDPSSADLATGFSYSFDFDNDEVFEIVETATAWATVPAAYLDDVGGIRTVRARITDKDGGARDYTNTIVVQGVAPTATISTPSATVDEGSFAAVVFSGQFDPSAADTTAGFKYSYDFNSDGVFEIIDCPSASGTVPALLLDDGPTVLTVRARIADKDGDFSDYTGFISVRNVAPTAALSNGGPVNQGSTASVSFGNQFDPSTADTLAGFTYSFDFDNNGTFEVGDGSYAGSGTSASATVPASFLAHGPGPGTGTVLDYPIDRATPGTAKENGRPHRSIQDDIANSRRSH